MSVQRWFRFRHLWRIILFGLAVVSTTSVILALYPMPQDKCDCTNGHNELEPGIREDALLPSHKDREKKQAGHHVGKAQDDASWGPHKLAVVIPFRDRFDELPEFVPHMHSFLNAQKVRHKIVVVNQQDIYRYINRKVLLGMLWLRPFIGRLPLLKLM